ncbi:MAG: AAA family ATPase [Gammaproteobacteria bacterium]|nr:AAA family ATPase [Gammaproteobacteria bacterium]
MSNKQITFSVLPSSGRPPSSAQSQAYLVTDEWDDWFTFSTLYVLIVFDQAGVRHDVGGVKIGQFQMQEGQRRPDLPSQFDELDERFFSLGQDDSYYEGLNNLGDELRNEVLVGLRDVAVDPQLFDRVLDEQVTKTSLLRSVTPTSVRGQFRRIAQGGARLSRYKFSYEAPKEKDNGQPSVTLSFEVVPESNPPTNIQVLIGRNGVGKTYLLNHMTRALVDSEPSPNDAGVFRSMDGDPEPGLFANLVSVTFSAFDPFEPLPEQKDRTAGIKYSYVGLKHTGDTTAVIGTPKTPADLTEEFGKSVRSCLQGPKGNRWRKALEVLEADPTFKEAEVVALAGDSGEGEYEASAAAIFGKLSSGHKIVLLTITRLVETVEERTLVLLDEPEAHLHPPLLSAFVRALSDLLVNRNGVAIIATHSPVVLQEVPKSCVWKLRRTGREVSAERPEIETFGENVGILTREVFGLEVTHSGFHKMLEDAIAREPDFESVVGQFGGELGAEARAITRALLAARDTESET